MSLDIVQQIARLYSLRNRFNPHSGSPQQLVAGPNTFGNGANEAKTPCGETWYGHIGMFSGKYCLRFMAVLKKNCKARFFSNFQMSLVYNCRCIIAEFDSFIANSSVFTRDSEIWSSFTRSSWTYAISSKIEIYWHTTKAEVLTRLAIISIAYPANFGMHYTSFCRTDVRIGVKMHVNSAPVWRRPEIFVYLPMKRGRH